MIIELIGLPGAGKSTIVNELLKENFIKDRSCVYEEIALKISQRKNKNTAFFLFFVKNISVILPMSWYYLFRSRKKYATLKRIKRLIVMLFILNENKEENILVLDQGVTQMFISIERYNRNFEKTCFEKFLKRTFTKVLKEEYKIIYISLPLLVSVERITSRRKMNCEFKLMDELHLLYVLENYQNILETLGFDLKVSSLEEPAKNVENIKKMILNNI